MPFCHTIKAEIPIKRNKIVQTGANNQLGGVKVGFIMEAYHTGIAGVVNMEPMKPTN